MDKTIEILEKSLNYAKKQLVDNLDKLESNDINFINKGLKDTKNFIEILKEINKKL